MPTAQIEINERRLLLNQHRNNLRKLRTQQSTYGVGEERLSLLTRIEYEQNAILNAKAELRQLGEDPTRDIIDPPEFLSPFGKPLLNRYPNQLHRSV